MPGVFRHQMTPCGRLGALCIASTYPCFWCFRHASFYVCLVVSPVCLLCCAAFGAVTATECCLPELQLEATPTCGYFCRGLFGCTTFEDLMSTMPAMYHPLTPDKWAQAVSRILSSTCGRRSRVTAGTAPSCGTRPCPGERCTWHSGAGPEEPLRPPPWGLVAAARRPWRRLPAPRRRRKRGATRWCTCKTRLAVLPPHHHGVTGAPRPWSACC